MPMITIKSKTVLWVLAFTLVCILVAIPMFNGNTAASLYLNKTVKKLPIYGVETTEKRASISFDAAWGADKTEKILEELDRVNVKATFFLVGFWCEEYPELVKKIDEKGHEVGLHSNSHSDMTKLKEADIELELTTNINIIKNIIGKTPTLFRPPFGAYNDRLITVCERLGIKVIQWSLDSHDWMGKSAGDIIKRIAPKIREGSIVLFHNNSDNILDALPVILDATAKKGIELTQISNLIYEDNYIIDHRGFQVKN